MLAVLVLDVAMAADRPVAVLAAAALSTLVAVCLVAGAGLTTTSRSARVRAAALRQRARGARVPVLRDPDAVGRPRPRAPSAVPAAA